VAERQSSANQNEAIGVSGSLEEAQDPDAAPQSGMKRQWAALDVLIVEDESVVARDIAAIVDALGHRVIGPARTHNEAIGLALRSRPSIIIADVKLADGSSGVAAVDEMLHSVDAAVIFVTGAPEWLATGESEPFWVISKPYSIDAVRNAVMCAARREGQALETIFATRDAVGRLTRKQ
jgi:DNA-binding LytR/AlgR family response regulator